MHTPATPAWLDQALLNEAFASAVPYLRAIARTTPAAMLVPAFAVKGAPAGLRGVLAVGLALPIARPLTFVGSTSGLVVTLVQDVLVGTALAIALALPIWLGGQLGALADTLRGVQDPTIAAPLAQDARGPLATLATLLVSAAWLGSGQTVVALALLERAPSGQAAMVATSQVLLAGLRLGLGLGSGLLILMLAFEVAVGALTRLSAPVSPNILATIVRPVFVTWGLAACIEGATRILVH